jgi:rare lipoprotein A (peptidoglycan hydrolase)
VRGTDETSPGDWVGMMSSGRSGRSLNELARDARGAAIVLAMLAPLAVAGCSSQNLAPASALAPPSVYQNSQIAPQVEVASWYGPGFQGRPTSTGERFNENAMTAASTTLPLGSRVRVTNPANGRSVEVRINDRGPYVRGRSIDLSKGAAEKLGIKDKGVAPVEVASLGAAPRMMLSPPPAPPREETHGRVHVWREPHSDPIRRTHYTAHHVRWRSSRRHSVHTRMVWNPVGAWIAGAFRGL